MSDKDERSVPTFRASREGLSQVLGDLEADIMEFLWSEVQEPVPARIVAERVGKERGNAYITVVTVLNNLCRKGLLRREKRGRAFYYEPQISREQFVRRVSREVLSGVVRLGPELAISSFVDVLAEVGPEEVEHLRRRLEERRREEREE